MKEHEIRKAGRGLVERAAAALAEAAFDRVAAVCLERVMRRLPLQRYRGSWQRELGRMAGAGDLLALRAAANDRQRRRVRTRAEYGTPEFQVEYQRALSGQ